MKTATGVGASCVIFVASSFARPHHFGVSAAEGNRLRIPAAECAGRSLGGVCGSANGAVPEADARIDRSGHSSGRGPIGCLPLRAVPCGLEGISRPIERIQLDLVHYLMFGLTIQVGADVLGTAVAPTVADLGALAGIVLIRAALSYFLSKDLECGLEETQEKRRKDENEL